MLIDPVPEEVVRWFVEQIDPVIKGKRIKLWLTKRGQYRVDTLAAVGINQAYPIELVCRGSGFYLFGEGVTPEMLAPIKSIFTEFCLRAKEARSRIPGPQLPAPYRSIQQTDPYWYSRLYFMP